MSARGTKHVNTPIMSSRVRPLCNSREDEIVHLKVGSEQGCQVAQHFPEANSVRPLRAWLQYFSQDAWDIWQRSSHMLAQCMAAVHELVSI
jgi:hypothetical protein